MIYLFFNTLLVGQGVVARKKPR